MSISVAFASTEANYLPFNAIRVVLLGLECAEVQSIQDADLILTHQLDETLRLLKLGHSVVFLDMREYGNQQKSFAGLSASYPEHFFTTDALGQLIVFLIELFSTKEDLFKANRAKRQAVLDSVAQLSPSSMTGKRVLVVDDGFGNRLAAEKLFAANNQLTIVASYHEAIKLLKSSEFDIVLTDLLLPTELKTLGGQGLDAVGALGQYGTAVALQAICRGVPEVLIVSLGDHHHDGAIAALETIDFRASGPTHVSFHNVGESPAGCKNWEAAYLAHIRK